MFAPRRVLGDIGNRTGFQFGAGKDALKTHMEGVTSHHTGVPMIPGHIQHHAPAVSGAPTLNPLAPVLSSTVSSVLAMPSHHPQSLAAMPRPLTSSNSFHSLPPPIPHQATMLEPGSPPQLPPLPPACTDPLPAQWDDIDIADTENPQACIEYVQEVYEHFMDYETHNALPDYMHASTQPELTDRLRATIVDWMANVHYQFKLLPETLFLSVALLDRFLALKQVAQNKLQLLGVTCLMTAAKYEEVMSPSIVDFEAITERNCPRADIIRMERTLLSTLKYGLTMPTVLTFLKRYAKASKADSHIGMCARFISELSLTDYRLCQAYRPSMVAAACIYHSMRIMKRPQPWDDTIHHYSGYSEASLQQCATDLRELVKKAPTSRLQALYHKHSSERYLAIAPHCVAEI
ncbi:putative G2/mitotic-specific cyclin-B [Paratrimastix pyriformis]|uniref:G2/mitotic-specific cyclin-B n=1 Tax=Paratrimastix pyriformis TaxID=342808 RepID=A0ABQ8UJ19_9EUKA|nr:putative G2/mitotic-specific cyclin-B [Paratrimastix pyriformis]